MRRPRHTPLQSANMHSPSITRLTGVSPLPNSRPGFVPPSHTSPACTCPLSSHLRTQTDRLLLVWSLLSGSTFLVHRPPSRDGSKSLASAIKASQVKGLAVPRVRLQAQPPQLPTMLPPHLHAANSPPPSPALASESMHKGDRSAARCLSSARSPRSSSPNRGVSCS